MRHFLPIRSNQGEPIGGVRRISRTRKGCDGVEKHRGGAHYHGCSGCRKSLMRGLEACVMRSLVPHEFLKLYMGSNERGEKMVVNGPYIQDGVEYWPSSVDPYSHSMWLMASIDRESSRWNLPPSEVQRRRWIFWETCSYDAWMVIIPISNANHCSLFIELCSRTASLLRTHSH
jgi:hypothetical protein